MCARVRSSHITCLGWEMNFLCKQLPLFTQINTSGGPKVQSFFRAPLFWVCVCVRWRFAPQIKEGYCERIISPYSRLCRVRSPLPSPFAYFVLLKKVGTSHFPFLFSLYPRLEEDMTGAAAKAKKRGEGRDRPCFRNFRD